MNDRGVTLVELLMAAAFGSLVLLGLGSFYLTAVRFSDASSSQSYLQRQGTMVIDEMRRQIIPATAMTRGTCNADTNSVGVTNKDSGGNTQTFCFYRSGTSLREDMTTGLGTRTLDLLSGLPVALSATSFTTSMPPTQTTVTVTFQLTDSSATGRPWRTNFMTFTTDLTRRN